MLSSKRDDLSNVNTSRMNGFAGARPFGESGAPSTMDDKSPKNTNALQLADTVNEIRFSRLSLTSKPGAIDSNVRQSEQKVESKLMLPTVQEGPIAPHTGNL